MKTVKIAAFLFFGAIVAPGMQAQIKHVEMRLEGMT